ncbi:MAG: 16S rRNA (adenine(1518)-N(6)/adenine(1519)-N(6))-dimethyltransferase RsmA [Longimicrobiales bacterium]
MGADPPPRAKRSLGQNFLVDHAYRRKIVDALGPVEGEEILEIGPGQGALTHLIAETGARLTAVELDDALAAGLEKAEAPNLRIVRGDALKVPLAGLFDDWSQVRVIGNIPYNITSPLIFRLLEAPRPREIVIMVQAEVAARIVADAGTKAYGALSVGVRAVAHAERLFRVPPTVFRPVPKVESAVLRITPDRPAEVTGALAGELRCLTRATFGWRRKQLGTVLRKHPDYGLAPEALEQVLAQVGRPHHVRPERLEPEEFIKLAAILLPLR